MRLPKSLSAAETFCLLGGLLVVSVFFVGYLVHSIRSDYHDRAADIDVIESLGEEIDRLHELNQRSTPRQEHASRGGTAGRESGVRFPGDIRPLRPEEQADRSAN